MNIFYSVRPGDEQVLVAAFKPQPAKIFEGQILDLQVRAHRAIKDDDAII
jgi:hypothetical protein